MIQHERAVKFDFHTGRRAAPRGGGRRGDGLRRALDAGWGRLAPAAARGPAPNAARGRVARLYTYPGPRSFGRLRRLRAGPAAAPRRPPRPRRRDRRLVDARTRRPRAEAARQARPRRGAGAGAGAAGAAGPEHARPRRARARRADADGGHLRRARQRRRNAPRPERSLRILPALPHRRERRVPLPPQDSEVEFDADAAPELPPAAGQARLAALGLRGATRPAERWEPEVAPRRKRGPRRKRARAAPTAPSPRAGHSCTRVGGELVVLCGLGRVEGQSGLPRSDYLDEAWFLSFDGATGGGAVTTCVEINQCVGCTRQFFTKSFLGDDADVARGHRLVEPISSL